MQKRNVFLLSLCLILVALGSSSCGQIMLGIIAPNQCKKCTVSDQAGNVVWSDEACGSGVYNMEVHAKVEAYDRGCDYRVNCETWKKEKTE